MSLIIGLIFFSVGVVATIRANIGFAPWEVFHVGLSNVTGLSIGVIAIIVGAVIVIIVTLLGERLGLGTIMNMIVIGLIFDIIFPHFPQAQNAITGTIMLLAGIFSISLGTYFYMRGAFGTGPRDSLMVALTRKTKLPVGLCRGIIELLVTISGFFLGGMVGFGTVIFVVAIGFSVQMTFKLFKFDPKAIRHETLRDTYTTLKNAMQRKSTP